MPGERRTVTVQLTADAGVALARGSSGAAVIAIRAAAVSSVLHHRGFLHLGRRARGDADGDQVVIDATMAS